MENYSLKAYEEFQSGNYAKAIELWLEAAKQGDVNAQYNLGLCYENGKAFEQGYYDEAFLLHSEAVRCGDSYQAYQWFCKAAEKGHAGAQYKLGLYCKEINNHHEASEWFRQAAEKGHAGAQYNLGLYCENNLHHHHEALKWYHRAAKQGYADAQYKLGLHYYYQRGDTCGASEWFRKAAKQGHIYAQYYLGVCYYKGPSVYQDYREASKWLRKAAEQGHTAAQYDLEHLYNSGYGTEDPAKSFWFHQPKEQIVPNTQYGFNATTTKGNIDTAAEVANAKAEIERLRNQLAAVMLEKEAATKAAEQAKIDAEAEIARILAPLTVANEEIVKTDDQITPSSKENETHNVYSSIFAPAEIKRKSNLLVQLYFHLYEDSEIVKQQAKESDKNAERRDYIPLSLKLTKGDKIDVEFNIYGESLLMSEHTSIIWQGVMTKWSFRYFVPEDIDVEELSCEAYLTVNGAMIGKMVFLVQIVDAPRNLRSNIHSHRFNKIFISYAHQDIEQVKFLALAYKAQGVDYFYDRHTLNIGDVFNDEIAKYIDAADLFILCWSKNAENSTYIPLEINRALPHAYPQAHINDATLKIYPLSIKPHTKLPDNMRDIYNFGVISD